MTSIFPFVCSTTVALTLTWFAGTTGLPRIVNSREPTSCISSSASTSPTRTSFRRGTVRRSRGASRYRRPATAATTYCEGWLRIWASAVEMESGAEAAAAAVVAGWVCSARVATWRNAAGAKRYTQPRACGRGHSRLMNADMALDAVCGGGENVGGRECADWPESAGGGGPHPAEDSGGAPIKRLKASPAEIPHTPVTSLAVLATTSHFLSYFSSS